MLDAGCFTEVPVNEPTCGASDVRGVLRVWGLCLPEKLWVQILLDRLYPGVDLVHASSWSKLA